MKQGRSSTTTMNYQAPKGPRNIDEAQAPGLQGDNCGKQGSQGPYSESKQTSGMVGLGGDSVRCCGTQGKH